MDDGSGPGRPAAGERISVGVDGSAASRGALRWALAHARQGDAITLVHVWKAPLAMVEGGACDFDDDAPARSLVHRELWRARELVADPDVEIQTLLLPGDARTQLSELDTDLLVLGTRGRGGVVSRLLGSVAEHVIRHASVPVVIVPARVTAGV